MEGDSTRAPSTTVMATNESMLPMERNKGNRTFFRIHLRLPLLLYLYQLLYLIIGLEQLQETLKVIS
jgi:hypothetical protein